jgi:hypothetical protein
MFRSSFLPRRTQNDTPSFTHTPLDLSRQTIRVLRVLNGPRKSTLECTVEHVPLDGRHTCLSYTWGALDSGSQILINGRTFKVRKNLRNFLLQAREDGLSDPLWIDAVCIDQQNVAERNHQVQQMALIYQQAKRVLIWLGRGREEADIVLGITQLLASYASTRDEDPYDYFRSCISKANPNFWKYAAKLDSAPYFKRLWIVQEVHHSRRAILIHGRTWCDWEYYLWLPKAASRWRRGRSFNTQVPRFFLAYALQRIDNQERAELRELIQYFRDFGCADPRDRVYALLSMVKNGDGFPVDYESDLLVLYMRACQYWPMLKDRVSDLMDLYNTLGAKATSARMQAVQKRQPHLVPEILKASCAFEMKEKGDRPSPISWQVWMPVSVRSRVSQTEMEKLKVCNLCTRRIKEGREYHEVWGPPALDWYYFWPTDDETFFHNEELTDSDLERAWFVHFPKTQHRSHSLEVYFGPLPENTDPNSHTTRFAPLDHHWIVSQDAIGDPNSHSIHMALFVPCRALGCFFRDRRQEVSLLYSQLREPFTVQTIDKLKHIRPLKRAQDTPRHQETTTTAQSQGLGGLMRRVLNRKKIV